MRVPEFSSLKTQKVTNGSSRDSLTLTIFSPIFTQQRAAMMVVPNGSGTHSLLFGLPQLPSLTLYSFTLWNSLWLLRYRHSIIQLRKLLSNSLSPSNKKIRWWYRCVRVFHQSLYKIKCENRYFFVVVICESAFYFHQIILYSVYVQSGRRNYI